MKPLTTFSPRLEHAIRLTIELHDGQKRKCGDVPYLSHLIHVALLVQAHGFSEDVVIAAVLHDTIEDTKYTVEDLGADFGPRICAIVLELTENKHLPWSLRKSGYLKHVRNGSPEAKAVCCADKIHNLSTIMDEYEHRGDTVWSAFSRGKELTLRFYRDAFNAISAGWDHPIVEAYRGVLERARSLIGDF
jgi:(p)ppGpp synthase/HD superfamily hydrolase